MSDEKDRSQKNAVFAGGDPQQAQKFSGIVTEQLSMSVPTTLIPLPTMGLVYPPGHPLHACETIEIKSMTAREEDILTTQSLIKNGTVISKLIESCVVSPKVNTLDMLMGDRLAAMIAVRITGYGEMYSTKLKCRSCSEEYEESFDLSKLGIKQLKIQPCEQYTNEFEFVLPRSKRTVRFKYLNGHDEEGMETQKKKMKKAFNQQIDSDITTHLKYTIVSIDNDRDKSKISRFVDAMPAWDAKSLRKYMTVNEPGIDLTVESTCRTCRNTEEMMLPLGIEFFWPDI